MTVYSVGKQDFEKFDDAAKAAEEKGFSSIQWREEENEIIVAEGGECIDQECNCHKQWTYWS